MKRWPWLGIVLLTIILIWVAGPLQAQIKGRGQGFRLCPYNSYKCRIPSTVNVVTPQGVSGKITKILTESLEEGMHPGMALELASENMGTVKVLLGPVWYLERQEFVLQPGDEVGVKGAFHDLDGERVLVASELTRGDYTLYLRDDQGWPRWEAWRQR